MRTLQFFSLLLLTSSIGCNRPELDDVTTCEDISSIDNDTQSPVTGNIYGAGYGALLGTRFKSLEELKSVIQIEYFNDNNKSDSASHGNSLVRVSHCSNGMKVTSVLASGISQGDIYDVRYGGSIRDRIGLVFSSPYVVINRRDLERVFTLARWRPEWLGEGDVAFFDLAETSAGNINTEDLAFHNSRDSTEKGYLNSFNHITAQAFITSCFSEEMADFVADVHERYAHPELITGKFTEEQVKDLEEGPVDNYVDMINNEWGQELGKQLKEKYNISRKTYWTPELLADYLNDLQHYYSWAFQIGFKPFRTTDEIVIRFSNKINFVMKEGRLRNNT